MHWSGKHSALRHAIAHLLTASELENVVCSFEQLISPLNNLSGVAGKDGFALITEELIVKSFAGRISDTISFNAAKEPSAKPNAFDSNVHIQNGTSVMRMTLFIGVGAVWLIV